MNTQRLECIHCNGPVELNGALLQCQRPDCNQLAFAHEEEPEQTDNAKYEQRRDTYTLGSANAGHKTPWG